MLSLFAGGWMAHANKIEYISDLRHRLVEGLYQTGASYTGESTGRRMTASVEMPRPTPTPSCPTFFTVNDNGDAGDVTPGDGVCATGGAACTLRAAIEEANALSSCGVIDINFIGVTSPISLDNALPVLSHSVNINGPGANLLTVQRSTAGGTPLFSIFRTVGSLTVNISNLTITGGFAAVGEDGGGIFIQSNTVLTLTGVNVSGNRTAAATSFSAGFGGGIFNRGTLRLINSTVSGNTTGKGDQFGSINGGDGGGIYNNGGILAATNTTISGNKTGNGSFPPGHDGSGGGIHNFGGSMTFTNSTISGNTTGTSPMSMGGTGAGINSPSGSLTLVNCTVSNNIASSNGGGSSGGGIAISGSPANLRNTIIANNGAVNSPDLAGLFNSQDYNLIKNLTGASFIGTTTHNITGVDPLLGPLANNGGSTLTHALLAGSPAIDAGDNCVLNNSCSPALPSAITTDQRGAAFSRSADGNGDGSATVDIGGFEVASMLVTNTNDSGDGSLRQAIIDANSQPGTNAINFQSGLNGTITLLNPLPDLSTSIDINGPGANPLTVMRSTAGGTPNFRIFHITSGVRVVISGLTISNGMVPFRGDNGGGILNDGTLILTDCNVYGNSAGTEIGFGAGGGIYSGGPSLVLHNCKIGGTTASQRNSSGANGGGISVGGTLLMTGGSIVGNSESGIFIAGTASLVGVTVTDNVASNDGGGIRVVGTSAVATIVDCVIANNTAITGGAGISNGLATVTLINSTVSGNVSNAFGGGVDSFNVTQTTLINSTVTNNRSNSGFGGGLCNSGEVLLRNTIVASNFGGASPSSTPNDIRDLSNPNSSSNLIGSCNNCGLTNGVNGNQIGVANPSLGPLANNGGPTLTHALLVGSPAIDAGTYVTTLNGGIDTSMTTINLVDASALPAAIGLVIQIDNEQMIVIGKVSNTLTVTRAANSTTAAGHNSGAGVNPAFDQRGADFPRIVNSRSDIGAYESHNLQVNSLADTDDAVCTDVDTGNGCTLREAISAANTQTGTESISFAPALTSSGPAAITLLNALPDLSSDMTITGPGANLLTVQRSTAGGTPLFRVFAINSSVTVSIWGLTIANGINVFGGGGVLNNGTLTLTNCNLFGNSAGNSTGGGIYNDGPSLTLTNCNIGGTAADQANNASKGGGVFHNNGTLLITGGSVAGNSKNGIAIAGGSVTINGVVVMSNAFGGGNGGGISALGGTIDIVGSLVANNYGDNGGGGIGIPPGSTAVMTVINTTISGNSTANIGGGLSNAAGTATLTNVTITNNRSGNSTGGGIFGSSAPGVITTLRNTIVAGNFGGPSPSTAANNIFGAINASSAFNLIGTGGSGGLVNGVNNNQVGVANPQLAPLANNGGPTQTHALLLGSPAIDAGDNSAIINPPFSGPPFTDQRAGSFNRIADGDGNGTATVDIGAYELQGVLTIDAVTPTAGRTSGGQQIILAGAFANLSTVTVGGASSSWFYTNGSLDTSVITVTTPAHAVGAVQIDLTPTSGSSYSKANAFAYLPTVFTDDTITVGQTTAKGQHIIELRQAVDALRAVAGLSPVPWTDPALTPFSAIIKAVHILELRSYLDDAATRLGYSTSPYTDPGLSSGFVIKRLHIEELRQRVRTIAG